MGRAAASGHRLRRAGRARLSRRIRHPPLVRLWAALPLRFMRRGALDTAAIDAAPPTDWVTRPLFLFSDQPACTSMATRTRSCSGAVHDSAAQACTRYTRLLLGTRVAGTGPAIAALAAYTLEPNIAAHASLVTTDLGVTCFVFAAVYFLWRLCRHPTCMNALGFVLLFVAAQLTKFSAMLLGRSCSCCGNRRRRTGTLRFRTAIWIAAAAAVASFAGVWLAYGLRYAPSGNAAWLYRFQDDPVVAERLPSLTAIVGWIDSHRLLPNAFSQGFLIGQAKAQSRDAFLAGHYSSTGWTTFRWSPDQDAEPAGRVTAAGIAVCVVRRASLGAANAAFVVVPIVAFMAAAMLTPLNIGLRHLLPIYPFCILLAAVAVSALSSSGGAGWH